MNLKQSSKFVVYCHTNILDGKRYIGITCQKLNQRFRNGKGYKSSPHFYNAIKLYGWDNFQHEILYENLTEDEAKAKEIELISKYKTQNNDFGYNITPGGEGFSGKDNPMYGKRHSESAKMKMSIARKGKPKSESWKRKISESEKGKYVSEETRKKMSENHADVSGSKNPRYGCKLSKEIIDKLVKSSKTPEAIQKMKEHKKWYSGAENPHAKSVMCIETGKVYSTINEAAVDTKCHASKISSVCHGKRKTTNNLHFKFMEEIKNE